MSRRRVRIEVTHPARTIILTDSASAQRPVVGFAAFAAPAAPSPRKPIVCINHPNSRVLRSRMVGVADGVSVAAVVRASGPCGRTFPAHRGNPGCRETRDDLDAADRAGAAAGRSYTRRRGNPQPRAARPSGPEGLPDTGQEHGQTAQGRTPDGGRNPIRPKDGTVGKPADSTCVSAGLPTVGRGVERVQTECLAMKKVFTTG